MTETEVKTLGNVAYDAYCETSNWKSLATGADLPQFADAKEEIKAAWEAAAKAVFDALTQDEEDKSENDGKIAETHQADAPAEHSAEAA